jgi:hypothetical protein
VAILVGPKQTLPVRRQSNAIEDVWSADRLLAELAAMPLDDETGEAVSQISELALNSDFAEAAGIVSEFPAAEC